MSLTKNEHLTKSFQNGRFATTLDTSEIVRIEWAITAMFYAALHFVQAYFVSRSSILPLTHKHRDTAIQRDPLISGAFHDYRALEELSREARYGFTNFDAADLTRAKSLLAVVQSVVRLHL